MTTEGMADDAAEVLKVFLTESHEILEKVDRDLVSLEKDPSNAELLAGVFRSIHTIKGNSGFLGFQKIERLTHAAEGALSLLRDGKRPLTAEIISALLATADLGRELLVSIGASGVEGAQDPKAIVDQLTAWITGTPGQNAGGVLPEEGEASAPRSQTPADTNVRVDVGLLDKLMNLVGELVLARNQLLQSTSALSDPGLQTVSQRLNLVTGELQEGVMKVRLQPIRNVLGRFPRVVRDLAASCGKKVRIDMEGEDTELDRTIIESIGDPLTHLLRNAVDHGIESPAERRARGKPEEGRFKLRAFHEGGQVVIELSDDGAGIDPAVVRSKALSTGLITPDEAARMSERELVNLIFRRGFSTSEKVTALSGRGVGMDVVKSNIERIGGSVDVSSVTGAGTTIKMRIPLTLAIIPALIVWTRGARYAIPQVSLLELVRVEGAVETIHSVPVYRLRGNLLPLVDLGQTLGLAPPPAPEASTPVNIVVLQAGDRSFGLIVDAIHDTEEIVVKPLSRPLQPLEVYAGATILGDGSVALILDVGGLAHRARVISELREPGLAAKSAPAAEEEAGQISRLLIFRNPGDGRMAIDLRAVSRLELLDRSGVEQVGGQDVVQYRNAILPLVDVAATLPERRTRPRSPDPSAEAAAKLPLQVVVYSQGDRTVGLVVEHILDIVEESPVALKSASRPGVSGCAVIRDRVTEILDVEAMLKMAARDLTGERP